MDMSDHEKPFHRFKERFSHLPYTALRTAPLLSDEVYENEKKLVFGKSWLCVGRETQVPKFGDFFVKEFPTLKQSVIIIRDRDGTLNAFHNVCCHRANKVQWEESGNCRSLTCKFHGWSYKIDGTLADVPDEDRFFNFDKSKFGLKPVNIETWRGFIFLCLEDTPSETLEEFLGEVGRYLFDYPFEKYSQCYAYSTTLNCNWKVVTDAFQEAYHVGFVHGRVLVDYHHEPDLHLIENVELYKRHATFGFPSAKDHHTFPTEAMGFEHSVNISSAVSRAGEEHGESEKLWGFVGNRIFPNFFCDILDGMYFTHEIIPVSKDVTWFEHRMYYAPAKTPGQLFGQETSKVMLRDILLEDLSTLEHTQTAIEGGVLKEFPLQDEEIVVRQFYNVLDNILREENLEPVYFPEG